MCGGFENESLFRLRQESTDGFSNKRGDALARDRTLQQTDRTIRERQEWNVLDCDLPFEDAAACFRPSGSSGLLIVH